MKKGSMKVNHDSIHPSQATANPSRPGPDKKFEPTIQVAKSLKSGKGAKVRGNA